MRIRRFFALTALAVAGLLGSFASTQASFVPVLTSPAPGGTSSVFTYSINFSTNGGAAGPIVLTAGDTVTLYDFGSGITNPPLAGSIVVTNGGTVPLGGLLTSTVQFVGITPSGLTPSDNVAVNNITFTYSGPNLTVDSAFTAIITTTGGPYTTRIGQYTSTDTSSTGNGRISQIGNVLVPTPVPEPTSVALMGLGLASGLGFYRRGLPNFSGGDRNSLAI
jgi:hypothetical protein